jgi:hypothetical protein
MTLNTLEQLYLRATVGVSWGGAAMTLATNEKFWGVLLAAIGAGAACLLAYYRNKREAERQQWAREEHEIRMSLMQRGTIINTEEGNDESA